MTADGKVRLGLWVIGIGIVVALVVSRNLAEDRLGRNLLPTTASTTEEQWVEVKYRVDSVNVGAQGFTCLDTGTVYDVWGACFDTVNDYMVINLQGTNYHYCRMPRDVWDAFANETGFGLERFYESRIRGQYDCRLGGIPDY